MFGISWIVYFCMYLLWILQLYIYFAAIIVADMAAVWRSREDWLTWRTSRLMWDAYVHIRLSRSWNRHRSGLYINNQLKMLIIIGCGNIIYISLAQWHIIMRMVCAMDT